MSTPLHNLFDIQPASKVASPAPTYQKSTKQAPQSLRDVGILPDIELDQITSGKSRNGQYTPGQATPGAQTPKTPNELEMSCPPTPRRDDAVGLMRTWNSPPMTKWRILSCCLIYLANGMNDSGILETQSSRMMVKLTLTCYSCRCAHSLHGEILRHLVLHHVIGLRRKCDRLHPCCVLHRHYS